MESDAGSVAPHSQACLQASQPEESSGSLRLPCRAHNPTEKRADVFGGAVCEANVPVLAVEPENSLPVRAATPLSETQQVLRPRHVAAHHALLSSHPADISPHRLCGSICFVTIGPHRDRLSAVLTVRDQSSRGCTELSACVTSSQIHLHRLCI